MDICPCGRPDHIELIYQLLDALGLQTTAMPVPPKQVWDETLEIIRRRRAPSLATLPRGTQPGWYSDRFGFHLHPGEWPLNITKRAHERCRPTLLDAERT